MMTITSSDRSSSSSRLYYVPRPSHQQQAISVPSTNHTICTYNRHSSFLDHHMMSPVLLRELAKASQYIQVSPIYHHLFVYHAALFLALQ